MKKIKIIGLLLISLFMCDNVKAYTMYQESTPINGSCVDNGTCLMMCQYQIEEKKTSVDQKAYSKWYQIAIYYHLDNDTWQISWSNKSNNKFESFEGTLDYLNKQDVIHFRHDELLELQNNGICPDLGYVDLADVGNSEVCLSNDKSYCDNDNSVMNAVMGRIYNFTDFQGSTTMTYSNQKQIDKYLTSNAFSNITCDDLKSSNGIEKKLKETFLEDFQASYLHGYAMPKFLQNYIFGSGEAKGKIEFPKQFFKALCEDQILLNKNTSVEQKNKELEQLEKGLEDLDRAITSVRDQMLRPTIDPNERTGCNIFGSLTGELRTIFQTIRFLMLGALIALTILDFIKAFASSKDDEFKKALKRFITRVIIVVVLFVLPLIINIILGIFFGGGFDTCLGTF